MFNKLLLIWKMGKEGLISTSGKVTFGSTPGSLPWRWLVLLFPFSSPVLLAQTVTNQRQLVQITANAIVTVGGSVINDGVIINNGSLAVSGDWDNRLTYNAGIGTFILNGSNPQLVNHRDQAFYTFRLDGAGEKLLESHANVSHELVFHQGILTPSPGKILLAGDTCLITEGNESSYVNGPFYQRGVRYQRYPIGKDGHYRPVTLDQIKGVDPQIGFEVFNGNVGGEPGPGIQEILPAHYWKRTMLTPSQTFQGALITLSFESDDNVKDIDALSVVEASDQQGPFRNLKRESTSGNSFSGTITGERRITGQVFALGMVKPNELNPNILYVPNAFSPNATHGEEKVLKVYGSNIVPEGFLFRIYNRWGNLIFESRSPQEIMQTGWDGRNVRAGSQESRSQESQGVYTYTLKGKFSNGQLFDKVGTISLIQ